MLREMNVKLRRGHFDLVTQLSVNEACVGLFGKSGAGKSTVLDLISGNIQPHTPRARQDLGLREGLDIYCLIKTHAIAYLSELDALNPPCAVNLRDDVHIDAHSFPSPV